MGRGLSGDRYTLQMTVRREGSLIYTNLYPNIVTQANLWKWWEDCLEDVIREVNDGAKEVKFVVTLTKSRKRKGR